MWNCTPEWYDDSNLTVLHPKPAQNFWQKDKFFMRDGDFSESDIELIAGGVSLQRQKLPAHVINLADAWLQRASKSDHRALRAMSSRVTK